MSIVAINTGLLRFRPIKPWALASRTPSALVAMFYHLPRARKLTLGFRLTSASPLKTTLRHYSVTPLLHYSDTPFSTL
jgi:hypothetical protein